MSKKRLLVTILIFLISSLFFIPFSIASEQKEEHAGHGFGPQLDLSGYDINMLIIISLVGLAITMVCAIFLERNVAKIASKTGSSIGTALMAIASSVPLLIISITLALEKQTELIIINVIGANVANLTLVLGFLTFIKPLRRGKSFGRGILALVILILSASTIFFVIGADFSISQGTSPIIDIYDAYVLIILFVIFILMLNFFKSHEGGHLESKNIMMEIILSVVFGVAVSWFANTTVRAFIIIAKHFSLPSIIIGSVIGVIGASLPELAIGIVCLVKREDEAVFSNLISSAIVNFNLGLGFAAIIAGSIIIDEVSLIIKLPFMFIILAVSLFFFRPKGSTMGYSEGGLTRFEGLILLGLFVAWVFMLITLA